MLDKLGNEVNQLYNQFSQDGGGGSFGDLLAADTETQGRKEAKS